MATFGQATIAWWNCPSKGTWLNNIHSINLPHCHKWGSKQLSSAVSELFLMSGILCIFFLVICYTEAMEWHLKCSNTQKKWNKIKWNGSISQPVALQCHSPSLCAISQLLITEQVRLQPECVPAAACLSNIPPAEINRSSSLHITTYQEEEGGLGVGVRKEEERRKKDRRVEECHISFVTIIVSFC